MATITKKKAEHPKDQYQGQEAVTSIMQELGKLSYEERQQFSKRFNEVLNQENDKRGQSLEFDTDGYY